MIYRLEQPVMGRSNDGREVPLLEEITLRLPTAGDLKKTRGLTAGVDISCKLIELLGGVPKELVEKIAQVDFVVLDTIIDSFFDGPAAAATRKANAWLRSQGLPELPPEPATSASSGAPSK